MSEGTDKVSPLPTHTPSRAGTLPNDPASRLAPIRSATTGISGPRPTATRPESSIPTISFNPYDEVANLNSTPPMLKLQPNRQSHANEDNTQIGPSISENTIVKEKQVLHEHHDHHDHTTGKPQKPLSPLRLRLWMATCLTFVLLAPIISIILGVKLHSKEMRYPGDAGITPFPGRTLEFEVVLISADPQAGSMRLDWRILRESGSSPCRADNLAACTEVEIMFDTNLLRAEGTHSTQEEILTSDRPSRPIFRFNATAFVLNDRFSRTPTFRTQVALFSPNRPESSLIFYPFDAYTAEIIFYARESGTNNTVGVRIAESRGIAVGFETDFEHSLDPAVTPGLVEATITLTRSTLVKSYSIVSTIAIWIITIILALVMITTVFFGFKQRGEVLLIPVATLFAFTQLRQSMPGAPEGFGDIVDLVGLVPCLAILALTAACSLAAFILTDPTDMPRRIRWKVIHDAFPSLKASEKDVEFVKPTQKPVSK